MTSPVLEPPAWKVLLPFSQLAMGIGQGVGALTFLSGDAAKVVVLWWDRARESVAATWGQ